METLLEIAKRLGIKPNPDMTWEEYCKVEEKIAKDLTGDEEFFGSLGDVVYDVHKHVDRNWDMDRFKKNVDYVINNNDDTKVEVYDQTGYGRGYPGFPNTFVYHSANNMNGEKIVERFALDLKQDSPEFPAVIDKLDDFIVKYRSKFKIIIPGHENRTDTMNLYMSTKITPEMAAELYDIVKPVLNDEYHDYLDGVEFKLNGKIIKGMKYGPDKLENVDETFHNAGKIIEGDLGDYFGNLLFVGLGGKESLGEVSARLQELELVYYLKGKKCPFDLAHPYGQAPDKETAVKWGYVRDSYDVMDITKKVYFQELVKEASQYLHFENEGDRGAVRSWISDLGDDIYDPGVRAVVIDAAKKSDGIEDFCGKLFRSVKQFYGENTDEKKSEVEDFKKKQEAERNDLVENKTKNGKAVPISNEEAMAKVLSSAQAKSWAERKKKEYLQSRARNTHE